MVMEIACPDPEASGRELGVRYSGQNPFSNALKPGNSTQSRTVYYIELIVNRVGVKPSLARTFMLYYYSSSLDYDLFYSNFGQNNGIINIVF